MSPAMRSYGHRITTEAKKVAIIGAGPSGLVAAKYLLAEQAFDTVTIFEQRSSIGGLWIHTPCPSSILEGLQVPQTDAHQGAETELDEDGVYLSPVYDKLETNIPRGLMGFSDLNWPRDCQLFPPHQAVLDYIQAYGTGVEHLIRFETQVKNVELKGDGQWLVSTKTKRSSEQHHFDAVIVANGHFRVEYIPPLDGLEAWHKQHPDSIYHSKLFRRAEDFADKKVVIVGNSASGIDIGAQIKQCCKSPMIQSSRSQSYLQLEPPSDQIQKPEIKQLIAESRTVVFADGSSEHDIDAIVFCTGYLYNYPFLENLEPKITSTGERAEHLYKHLFYYPAPTLSFLVVTQKVIPFPTAEAQAAVVARYLAGKLELPSYEEMHLWEQDRLGKTARMRDFHVLKFPEDADYINEMYELVKETDKPVEVMAVKGGERSGSRSAGKTPPFWTEQDYWTRERFPDIKRAFNSLGENRRAVTKLEEIGFDYERRKDK